MKRFLFFLFLIIGPAAWGQNVFSVFKCTDGVQRLNPITGRWDSVHRQDTLKLASRILVPSGGQIAVLEGATGIIYRGYEGKFTIKEIIDEGKKTILQAVGKQILDESAQKGRPPKKKAYGAVSRGSEDGKSAEELLAVDILSGQFSFLSVGVSPADEDGCAHLILTNASQEILPVNIAAVSRSTSMARVVIPTGVWAAPGQTPLDFIPVSTSGEPEYLPFVAEEPLDAGALARHLSQLLNQ